MTLPLDALERFLRDHDVPVQGPLRSTVIAGGKSNLTYSVEDDVTHWIVRRPPTGGLTPSAHDMKREWTVTSALQHTAVPVPTTVVADLDGTTIGAPFTVVAFQEGRIVRSASDLEQLDDAEVDKAVGTLVGILHELHRVELEAVGLEKFGRAQGFLERQVALWARQVSQVATRPLPDLDRLVTDLSSSVPTRSVASVIHGDYRIDNVILDAQDAGTIRGAGLGTLHPRRPVVRRRPHVHLP